MIEKDESLYDCIMCDLIKEQLNDRKINLTRIDILLIVILIILIIPLIIRSLSFKMMFGMKYKIQSLEKLNKIDHRNIQIQRNLMVNQLHHCINRLERNKLRFSNNQH